MVYVIIVYLAVITPMNIGSAGCLCVWDVTSCLTDPWFRPEWNFECDECKGDECFEDGR